MSMIPKTDKFDNDTARVYAAGTSVLERRPHASVACPAVLAENGGLSDGIFPTTVVGKYDNIVKEKLGVVQLVPPGVARLSWLEALERMDVDETNAHHHERGIEIAEALGWLDRHGE